jgi:hypothetical protein
MDGAMNGQAWSSVEADMVEQLAGDVPPDQLIDAYNQWADQKGYPQRSKQAILSRVKRSGLSNRAIGEWVSSGYICRVLDVGYDRANRLSDHREVHCHRADSGYRYFKRSDLRRAAKESPEIFRGISANRLYLLLEDRELSESIAAAYPLPGNSPKSVCAIETGWTFPSINAACRHFHVSHGAIQQAIRTGRESAGYHWTYA